MSHHHSEEQPTTSGTREPQIRRTWWQRAKDIIKRWTNNDTSGDASLSSPVYKINTDTKMVPAGDSSAPSTMHVDQGEAQVVSERRRIPEPEATVAHMTTDVLSKSSMAPETANRPAAQPSGAYTPRSTSQIYFSDMLKPAVGYPIFMPTPSRGLPEAYRKHGIRVGDVGAITANGAFDFMFNTCEYDDPPDEEINPNALPDGFDLLKQDVQVKDDKFGPRAIFTGQHVNEINGRDRPTFECAGHGGGVLALPNGAVSYEAVNKQDFQNHASRHAISWYKYMLDMGRDYPNGSLYFVTESIKSTYWGVAAFYGQNNPSNNLRLTFDGEMCRWEYRGKVETRVGPGRTDRSDSDGAPNQCVFLRGYRIMLRRDIWNKLMSAAMGYPYQDGEFSSPLATGMGTRSESFNQEGQLIRTHWLGDVILEEDISASTLFHPSDSINAMLLNMRPEAKVALVHDSVWCDHLPHDFIANPFAPDIGGLLENVRRSHEVGVDQHESAVLITSEID